MLLPTLRSWAPFRIDALGIVTLLGAQELDLAVGQLARNRYTENLPVLAAYILANNSITKPLPGFVIYNVTDGIMATDITPWFARWLACANITYSRTTLVISVRRQSKESLVIAITTGLIGLFSLGILVVMAVVTEDWWGLANCSSMLISVCVRRAIVSQLRQGIDAQLTDVFTDPTQVVKCFCTLPDGNCVTLILERDILVNCLLSDPQPPCPVFYKCCRIVGWIGFGCHVISLGMACLAHQVLSVLVLLVATVLVASRAGNTELRIGSRLYLERLDSSTPGFRSTAFARLRLTPQEEASMLAWNLLPQRSNQFWWLRYRQLQDKYPI